MFKRVLVPTDGATFSAAAARNAIAHAKSNGASVTAMTVSLPYRVFSTDYAMVTDTEEKYDDDCARRAGEYLGVVREAARQAEQRACVNPATAGPGVGAERWERPRQVRATPIRARTRRGSS